ncbi:hypothetical protein JVU11DRAFT_9679 [Chiua virens]|nr:hypothetical protein JVU11DRAFT_9679 [Chiua virens]
MNNTSWDLYLNAFLFNTSSLSIVPYYVQTGAGKPHAPLKQNRTFSIGYGPGGTVPFSFWIEESQDVDVGYLKIFFTTQPIGMSNVAQTLPFTPKMDE